MDYEERKLVEAGTELVEANTAMVLATVEAIRANAEDDHTGQALEHGEAKDIREHQQAMKKLEHYQFYRTARMLIVTLSLLAGTWTVMAAACGGP